MSQVEPGLMGWCEQKNNQKTRPGSKILTLEIAGFNPGLTWVWPALSVVWKEITDYDPGYQKLGIAWAAETGLKGCFASPALSLATSCNFWHGVADVFDDFYEQPLLRTTVIDTRRDGARSRSLTQNR